MRTIFAEFPEFTTTENILRVGLYMLGMFALGVLAVDVYMKRYKYRASHRLGTGRHSGTPVDPFYIARFQGKTGLIRRHAA